MNKFLLALALVAVATPVLAADLSDRSEYTCDNDTIKSEMDGILSGNPANIRLIYVKGATEVSRSSDELRCRVTLVTSMGSSPGVFRFWNQDGHTLVKFQMGAKK